MIVYLLAGYAGSGKTTAGALLEKLIPDVRTIAFADAVKKEVAELYNFPHELCFSQSGKASVVYEGKTVRQLLIEHSYEKKQLYGADVWAQKVVNTIKSVKDTNWIIHDWRYVEEYNCLRRNLDAKLITMRIVRSSVLPLDIPSEHDLDNTPVDFTIYNDSNIIDLQNQLFNKLKCEVGVGIRPPLPLR